jgi:hypothetical protein
VKGEKENKRR